MNLENFEDLWNDTKNWENMGKFDQIWTILDKFDPNKRNPKDLNNEFG